MRYLKNFKHFENLETDITDEPDVKLAKDNINDLQDSLKEFPEVKAKLDQAFMDLKSNKDNELLNKKIEEITKDFPKNPFIELYTRVINLQTKIKSVQEELIKYNDSLYQNEEDLKQITKDKGDPTMKTKTINDIKANQKIKTKEIADIKKELIEAEANLKSKMKEINTEMQDSSKKITSI
jgi:hypothetical protein